MNNIKLTKRTTNKPISNLKTYFNEELHQKIGGFEVQFLIDFFAKDIGHIFIIVLSGCSDIICKISKRDRISNPRFIKANFIKVYY